MSERRTPVTGLLMRPRRNSHSYCDRQDRAQRTHEIETISTNCKPTTPFQALEAASKQPETAADFERLADAMEGARDCARDFLNGREDQAEKEKLVRSIIFAHADRAWERAQAALAGGVIDADLAHDVGYLMLSISYVTSEGRMWLAAESFRLEDYL